MCEEQEPHDESDHSEHDDKRRDQLDRPDDYPSTPLLLLHAE